MIKALFFDIDGTLVSMASHQIPPSAVQAITQAKVMNCKVFIATGRPFGIINNIEPIEPLIDGYITASGAHCFVGDVVVYHHPLQKQEVETVLADAREQDYSCVVVGEQDITTFNYKDNIDRIFRRKLDIGNIDYHLPLERVLQQDILQITPFLNDRQERQLLSRLPHCIAARWHPEFADLTSDQADKGKGLEAIARYIGVDLSECAAFGDGGNDMSLIKTAGMGVAMGNAGNELKQMANFVTTDIDADGIRNALLQLQIIS